MCSYSYNARARSLATATVVPVSQAVYDSNKWVYSNIYPFIPNTALSRVIDNNMYFTIKGIIFMIKKNIVDQPQDLKTENKSIIAEVRVRSTRTGTTYSSNKE